MKKEVAYFHSDKMKGNKWKKDIEEEERGNAIAGKPIFDAAADDKEEVPREVQVFLDKYEDIVVEELPNSLPPIRDVRHHIDLIPGASLPNKAAYKMTPQKNREIKNQVQELLDKGLLRKSLSSCALPTGLAPKKDGKWRPCMNLRRVSKITIKYRFPISWMEDFMDNLAGARYFSKTNLESGS